MAVKTLDQIVPGGPAEADDQRHCRVRTGFMHELVTDPRVAAAFVAIDDTSLLLAAARHCGGLADQLVQRAGLPNREALFTPTVVKDALDRLEPTTELQALVDAYLAAVGDSLDRHRGITGAQLLAHLGPFVRDTLQLPWRWVVDDLMARYEQLFWHFLLGVETEMHYVVSVNVDQPFEWRPGETWDQASARQQAGVAAAKTSYETAKHHRLSPQLEMWGAYLYRRRVKQPPDSIGTLARDYRTWRETRRRAAGKGPRAAENDQGRKEIYDALAEAERLLNLKP